MSTPPRAASVRLALPTEASQIAALQRRAWGRSLPADLAEHVLRGTDLDSMTATWQAAVARPPEARCRVLVAVTTEGVVAGFATTTPSPDADGRSDTDGAIEEFAVDPVAQGQGHGSRLLHAAVDTLRADGFCRATTWVGTGNDDLRRFLTGTGWVPDGGTREIGTDDGARLRQVRLHTAIDDFADQTP